MRALGVVESKVFRQAHQQLAHGGVAVEVDVFMLDAPPKPLHKDVVIRPAPAPAVHADGDPLAIEHAREGLAGELAAMVTVEHLGLAMLAQGVLLAVHAKRRIHAVTDSPAQHPPGVPVDHSHQVSKTARQPYIGVVRAPDLVGPHHGHATQEIGVHLVQWVRRARLWPWCHPSQRHAAHEALHPLAVDPVSATPQVHHHLAAAVEGVTRVFLVDQALEHLV